MSIFPASIRRRIQLWYGALLLAVLAAFGWTAWRLQWQEALARVDAELAHPARMLLNLSDPRRPQPPGEPPGFPPGDEGPPDEPRLPRSGGPSADLRAWLDQPGPEQRYARSWRGPLLDDAYSAGELANSISPPDSDTAPRGVKLITTQRGGRTVREAQEVAPRGIVSVIGRSLEPEAAAGRKLAWQLTAAGGAVWLVAFCGGGWLVRRALRPVEDISGAARRIADGNLRERIPLTDAGSELHQLSGVLNETFARLEEAFERQSRFTADAAHELRTPLSVILSQTQLALSRERPASDYRDSLEMCARAAGRMKGLTESLLQLARLDAGAGTASFAALDLAEAARTTAELLSPLAEEKGIVLKTLTEPAPASGDAGQLSQVLTNLIQNALQHTPSGGTVTVKTGSSTTEVWASVEDTGPGIPAGQLPQVFDRFFRADASRNRNTGGAGLGLAICQAIIKAHSGSIEAASPASGGCLFTIRLPRRD